MSDTLGDYIIEASWRVYGKDPQDAVQELCKLILDDPASWLASFNVRAFDDDEATEYVVAEWPDKPEQG